MTRIGSGSKTVQLTRAALVASVLSVSTAAVAHACVADPAAVTAYAVTEAMTTTPMPDAMATKLDAAVRASLDKAAAPGIIAGVLKPDGY
ncbi:hypothetical protein [Martelella limonii]|uniref:hypothetical protein n=1 Tax=Martelella limonii TaxID=1647649 RepID=UPI001580D4AD|nr:hypothetical protein [Martelella limonii]